MAQNRIDKMSGKALAALAKQHGLTTFDLETEYSLRKRVYAVVYGKKVPEPVFREVRPLRWWLTFIWTWQVDLLTLIAVLFIRVAWGRAILWRDGLWAELRENSWPMRTWYREWGGSTFCHGGMLATGRSDVLPHELVHVEQAEARMLAGFVLGLASMAVTLYLDRSILHAVISLEIPWLGTWLVGYLASLAQAFIRGEDPYRGSHLEEAAYALTDDD